MNGHPPVILRRPHTRTRYTSDPDAIPYRGRYDHTGDRTYLTGTPALDTLGRRNGCSHTWLEYRCAYIGCGYVLLIQSDHAHTLAVYDHASRERARSAQERFRQQMRAITSAFQLATPSLILPNLTSTETLHLTTTPPSLPRSSP